MQITLLIPKTTSNDQSHNWCAEEIIDNIQHRACLSCLASEQKTKFKSHDADHDDPTAKVDAAICLHFCSLTHKCHSRAPRLQQDRISCVSCLHCDAANFRRPAATQRTSSVCKDEYGWEYEEYVCTWKWTAYIKAIRLGIWGIRMYMEMNSIHKSHTVGNMRNTYYVHGNEQHI